MDLSRQAKWIWLPDFVDYDSEAPGRFVLFRKALELSQTPRAPCQIHVSADTRYRLFVNGTSVAFGPCKSYPSRWFYETIDVAPYLRAGNNIITARVLRFFPAQIGSSSLMKANVPGFILWGDVEGVPILTDGSWQCCEDRSVLLQPRSQWNYILGPPFLSLDERVDVSKANLDWQSENADESSWKAAVSAVAPVKMVPALDPWKLFERPIPLLPEISQNFRGGLKCSGRSSLQEWNNLIQKGSPLRVEADEQVVVEFESSVLTTGFLELDFNGGRDTEVTILYAESYEKDLGIDKSPFPLPRSKGDRRDYQNGRLYGTEDHITLAAEEEENFRYEPFWFRTFRFIRLSITSKSTPVTVQRIAFRETRYPLEITTKVTLPPQLTQIWNICLNTLRNCMHETYEDCPFYEQNQFAMDGRLQLLFTYQLSRDDRLARKTIHEFHASRRDDGLLETNSPCSFRAINIPQFSLFWILMLHDHMVYFGDHRLIRTYIGTADGILEHFDSLLNNDGLVGKFDPESWAFVDWVKEWQGTKGIRDMAVPPIYKRTGVAAYNSLLYAWVLQHAAELCHFIDRHDTADEYTRRANSLNHAVTSHCWTGSFFLDGPGADISDISEHTQIFAILSGAITDTDAVELMRRVMSAALPSSSTGLSIPHCSPAMTHYVFRALSKTGLYTEYFDRMLRPWVKMLEMNLTSCVEDDVGGRSDCHAWSAGVVFEVVREGFGVGPGGWGDTDGVEGEGEREERRRKLLGEEARLEFVGRDGVVVRRGG